MPLGWRLEQNTHLQKGLEGGSGELQSCRPDLGSRESAGIENFEYRHAAGAGQPGPEAQTAWGWMAWPRERW